MKENKLIPVITITVYLGTEGDNRLYRIQDINQAAFRGTRRMHMMKEKMQEVLQNDEKFSKVDRETVEAINLFAGTDIDIDEKRRGD